MPARSSFGPAAPVDGNLAEDFFDLRRRWFDRWIKGVAQRGRRRAGGAGLRHGRRLRAAQPRRPARPWRALARCRRVAAAGDPLDPLLSAPRPRPRPACRRLRPRLRSTMRFDPRDPVPTMGGAMLGRAGHARRRLRPAQGRGVRRTQPTAARRSRRRAGLRDAAARPRPRNRRADHGAAVDRLRRAGHRLHRQADRPLSAERRLSRTALR